MAVLLASQLALMGTCQFGHACCGVAIVAAERRWLPFHARVYVLPVVLTGRVLAASRAAISTGGANSTALAWMLGLQEK